MDESAWAITQRNISDNQEGRRKTEILPESGFSVKFKLVISLACKKNKFCEYKVVIALSILP